MIGSVSKKIYEQTKNRLIVLFNVVKSNGSDQKSLSIKIDS